MAEASESPKANTDETGDSTDQEFELSADMMVHDMDDETTLEEEELLEGKEEEEINDELEELQKEGDMPLEDLLAMYGGHFGENPDTTTDDAVPLEEIKPEPLPPLVEANESFQEQIEQPVSVMTTEEQSEDIVALTQSPLSAASYAETPPSPSSPPTSQTGNLFPENQRITRGLAAAYFNESESSSEDEDYSPFEDWKKEIQIGPEHQAEVPEFLNPYTGKEFYGDDKCLWNPRKLSDNELQSYLNAINRPPPLSNVTRDDEQALYLLLQCGYNVEEAVKKRQAQANPQAEMALWSEEECREFESGLRMFGKDFKQIQQLKVMSRTVGELVQFYYLWKKTERHDAFACQSRLSKKKYAFHPGITDYMDRFLDENESAASSRASSPSFARVRTGNGIMASGTTPPSQLATADNFQNSIPTSAAVPVASHGTTSHHHTTSIMASLHSSPERSYGDHVSQLTLQQQKSCVPTSVIVQSAADKVESETKRPRLLQDGHKSMYTIPGKPPPLKPIRAVPSPLLHTVPTVPTGTSGQGLSGSNELLHSSTHSRSLPVDTAVIHTKSN